MARVDPARLPHRPSLMAIDMTTGTYDPHRGLGTLSGLFMVRAVRPGQVGLVGVDRTHSGHRRAVVLDRARLPRRNAGPSRFGEPVMD